MGNRIVNLDGTANLGLPIASVFVAQTLCWAGCQIVKDNSWIDSMWSLTFLIPNAMILGSKWALKQPIDTRTLVMNACLTVWSLRLSGYISCRHKGEDYRYVSLRKRMSKNGQCMYYLLSFLLIFMLQASLAVAVNYTCLFTTAYSSARTFGTAGVANGMQWTDWFGTSLFAIGFLMEAIADNQLANHIANKDEGKGKFCKTGFWRYSRHPNYFGETMLWWGLWMFSLQIPGCQWTFLCPLLMHLLLYYVSGVRLLEKKQSRHPEFAQYAAETNTFIPWFPDLNAKADIQKKDDDFKEQLNE
jgi:steroid 5-alpha reductase family enzyme